MILKTLPLLALVAFATAHHERVHSMQQVKVKQLYDSVVTPEYNANVRPYGVNSTDYVTYVSVAVRDVNVINVDEERGLFTFQGYLRKEWVDPRLAYNDSSVDYLPVKECRGLWTPDLYTVNGVDVSTFPKSYHHPTRVVKIYPNGRVFFSGRGTKTVLCPKIFDPTAKEFVCPVQVASYGYFNDEVKVTFPEGTDAITVAKNVFPLPKFRFTGATVAASCDETRYRTDEPGHVHSCIQVDFKFTRV